MNVWMLDLDPGEAARAHDDVHVKSCPFTYAQVLAAAWHNLHNAACQELKDVVVETPWFKYVVPDPQPYNSSAARPRAMFPGETPFSWWTLFGQRVPSPRFVLPLSVDDWAAQSGGNYRWLWQLSMELVAEYRYRFGRRHPAAPAIWTLEVVPFCLRSLDDWTEPPLDMPEHHKVRVDGFYDAVASCRRYYNRHEHTWTGRGLPDWFTKEDAPAEAQT